MVGSPSYIIEGIRRLGDLSQGYLDPRDREVIMRRDFVLKDCRSMFRVSSAQSVHSKILIRAIDQEIGGDYFNVVDVTSNQYKSFFMFFNAVRDESPSTMPVFRAGILDHYETWLSSISYPQLVRATSAETVHHILEDIRDRGLADYYDHSHNFYGPEKTPHRDCLTLGEFAAYRLRMGHGVIGDFVGLEILGKFSEALDFLKGIVPVDQEDTEMTTGILNLVTSRTIDNVESYIELIRALRPE